MKTYIANNQGDPCSLLISWMDAPTATTYASNTPFLVKIEGEDSKQVTIYLASNPGKGILTTLMPGWNPELVVKVIAASANVFKVGR